MSRAGIGYDVHRFEAGRRLILGGVEIPSDQGLAGHSDADVILHAAMDALLGAAGLGDIGVHFPPTDEAWRDISSLVLLEQVGALLEAEWQIINLDLMVIAEHPRIGPYRYAMREKIATTLHLRTDQVNIKATSNEGLGFIGRAEGIAALATASIEARERPVARAHRDQ